LPESDIYFSFRFSGELPDVGIGLSLQFSGIYADYQLLRLLSEFSRSRTDIFASFSLLRRRPAASGFQYSFTPTFIADASH